MTSTLVSLLQERVRRISQYSNRIINTLVWELAYKEGLRPPKYPLPVIIRHVEWVPWYADDPHHNSIIIWWCGLCRGCQGYAEIIDAVFDYDFDRSMDFYIELGKYTNADKLQEGIDAYMLENKEYLKLSRRGE